VVERPRGHRPAVQHEKQLKAGLEASAGQLIHRPGKLPDWTAYSLDWQRTAQNSIPTETSSIPNGLISLPSLGVGSSEPIDSGSV